MKKNKFSKALRHLKSTELDEKIRSLNEAPTNAMSGVYSLNQPGHRLGPQDPTKVFYPDVDGNWPSGIPGTPGEGKYIRPTGYWETGPGSAPSIDWDFQVDLSHSDASTDGFIDSSTGQVLTPLPPNSDHFILGPLVDGYTYNHGYDDFTTIGYIQKDTRQLVVLATIPGYWKSGVSGLRSSGVTNRQWDGETISILNPSFTLEMAEWFRDRYNENKYVNKVSYFYSGGQPQTGNTDPGSPSGSKQGAVPGVGNGSDASSSGPQGTGTSNGDPSIGTPQNAANHGGPEDAKIYNPQDPRNKFPKTVDPKDPSTWPPEERAKMSAEDLAELGLNLLNIGLDIAAVAGIIFPEPGTTGLGLARIATRLGQRAGTRALNSARNRALRGALNPLGQRVVRSGPAGRQGVSVYTGRSGFGPMRNKPGKTVFASPDRGVAGSYARSNQLLKGSGRGPQGGTVYRGTLPQRYVDKYGSRNVFGQRQVKMSKGAADKAFRRARGLKEIFELLGLLVENEAAPVTSAEPSAVANTETQKVTPEQEKKVNQTADELVDQVDLSEEDTADLAVETEEQAVQQEVQETTPNDLIIEWGEIIDDLPNWDMTVDDLKPYMNDMYSYADQLIIINNSNPSVQEQFLTLLGMDMSLLRNFTDENFRKIGDIPAPDGSKYGNFSYMLIPGGTPSTGWDGKFYSWGDPQLEKSRIVSQEEYQAAKLRPDFYGLETPDIAEPGYRYAVKPPRWSGGQPSYEYSGVTREYDKKIEAPIKKLTGPINGGTGYGLGIGWDLSIYNGTVDTALKGYEGALERAIVKATNLFSQLDQTNLSNLVASRVYNLQAYSGIYGGVGKSNQLTDETWNLYDFAFRSQSGEDFSQLFSISGPGALYNPSAEYYGGADELAREKRYAEEIWSEWSKYKEFAESLKTLNWADYELDEWFGEGEKTKRHPLLGMDDPEPEPDEEPKEYPPELNELGGDQYLDKETITKDGFKQSDGDYDIFVAGGGNAKMAKGFTYEQVMEIGRENLNVLSIKSLDNKTDTKFQYKNGKLDPIGYSVANERIDNAINLSTSLSMTLGISILTGQSRELKLGDIGKADMIQNVDPNVFGSALKFGPAIRPTVDNAVDPTPGKKLNVFTGLWGAPGGVEVDYDPRTDTLTFTSNKMLRKGEDGDEYNDIGTVITRFGDIPTPSKSDIANKSAAIITQIYGSIGIKPPGGQSVEQFVPQLANYFTKNQFANGLIGAATQLMDFGVQGTASNIVALRNLMTNAGLVSTSDMEQTYGGYGHVYTQTSYTGSEIPQELREIINKKTYSDAELTPTDAATAAYERKKREEEERLKSQKEQFSSSKSEVLSESRRRILREIKQPYELPEITKPKYRMNFRGKFKSQNTPDVTASNKTEQIVSAKNSAGQTWREQDKHWTRYQSTERMNIIYDNVGHGSQYFDMIVNENQGKKGWRDREIQEQLNLIAHEKAMRQINSDYESPFDKNILEQETMQYDDDPLFKKVAKKLKNEIDYPNKPSKAGYPDKSPPNTQNGKEFHPEMGQKADYYKRLDPHSAETMPPTGNPKIDANIQKALDMKKKARKLKNIIGKGG